MFLLPMAEQLHKLGGEFKGLQLTQEQIRQADDLATSFTRLRYSVTLTMRQIAAAIAPAVNALTQIASEAGRITAAFARDMPVVTTVIAGVAVGIGVLGAELVAVGGIAFAVSRPSADWRPSAACCRWSSEALATPLGLAAIAIAAVGLAIFTAIGQLPGVWPYGANMIDFDLKPFF